MKATTTIPQGVPEVNVLLMARGDSTMAGWYKQHTSELAALEMLYKCGRQDLVLSWLRVTRWSIDNESDELPEEFEEDVRSLGLVGLSLAFESRCKTLLKHRSVVAASRDVTRPSVTSRDVTRRHKTSRDNQDKTRQEKEEEKREEKREILQPTLSDLNNAGAREAEPAPKPEPSFDEFQATLKSVMEARRDALGIRVAK